MRNVFAKAAACVLTACVVSVTFAGCIAISEDRYTVPHIMNACVEETAEAVPLAM